MLDEQGAALLAQKGTWLVPTLEVFQRLTGIDASVGQDPVSQEKSKRILKFQSAAFQLALQNHVKVAFGLDDDPDFLDREFVALVRGGMKPFEALQAATVNAAELLGLSDQIGTIEPGKFADIIAVSGDPLTDISRSAALGYAIDRSRKTALLAEKPRGTVSRVGSIPARMANISQRTERSVEL